MSKFHYLTGVKKMEVFIGNLSAKAKLIEIHNILGDYNMHSDFTTFEGKKCDHSKYHFVVVTVGAEKQALELISRLNKMEFCGQLLDVREYIHRDTARQQQYCGVDRRINEQLVLAI
ncbi:MAG: hypothetical protein ISR69_01280 [Gammaproteobacteria bacterium]|nr:hypothetical protein [Gammaproteobacteria bacterium]